jgi:hypothetical protein
LVVAQKVDLHHSQEQTNQQDDRFRSIDHCGTYSTIVILVICEMRSLWFYEWSHLTCSWFALLSSCNHFVLDHNGAAHCYEHCLCGTWVVLGWLCTSPAWSCKPQASLLIEVWTATASALWMIDDIIEVSTLMTIGRPKKPQKSSI